MTAIGPRPDDRFRAAARAYFLYGVVYLVGGAYLTFYGVGVRGATGGGRLRDMTTSAFVLAGLVLVFLIPYLLRRRRPAFERWVLSRRDFARVLSALMAYRAYAVVRVMVRPDGASVSAPWGSQISFRTGAIVFFVVTVVALALVARAAWTTEGEHVA